MLEDWRETYTDAAIEAFEADSGPSSNPREFAELISEEFIYYCTLFGKSAVYGIDPTTGEMGQMIFNPGLNLFELAKANRFKKLKLTSRGAFRSA